MTPRRGTSGGPRRLEQEAHDVLDGRVRAGAGELLALIHAVNPTGLSLKMADERRRYHLKARLQSLLVRRFPDDLVVTAETGGVVAIGHRYLRQDACHARLDELELDARAWIRGVLDLAEDPDAEPEPMSLPSESCDVLEVGPLALGRAALDEYDYEAARAHFEHAVDTSAGSVPAARALVGLLVDHLGLDDAALATELRLSADAKADGEVRDSLALAAARSGDVATAHRLLKGRSGTRAGDAWASVAQWAVDRDDRGDLDRALDHLAAVAPAHPDRHRLRDEASRLRAEARRPDEEALARRCETGNDLAIESEARAVLARWPESALAGQVLARLQAQRRHAEAERLLASAEAALEARDVRRAAELARRASASGAITASLRVRIDAAEADERRARADAGVATATALLAADDPRPGMEAYLALDPDLRERVRGALGTPILDWLEAAAQGKVTRLAGLIDAILVIGPAIEAHDRGDDDGALAILAPHAETLAGVAQVRTLRGRAQRNVALRRREDAATTLAQARRALDQGDHDQSERLVNGLDRRALDDVARAELDQIVAELRARRELARRLATIDALAEAGELVGARGELDALLAAEIVDDARAESLRARRADLTAEVRRTWHVRADDSARRLDDRDPVGELLGRLPYMEAIATWLVADGAELVIATAHGSHVFIGRVSVGEQRLTRRLALRAPESLSGVLSMDADEETVWLFGKLGRVLQVNARTGEPVRWSSLTPFLRAQERIERVFLLPGGEHLWIEASVPGQGSEGRRVIEIDGWRLRRELSAPGYFLPMSAGGPPSVVGTDPDAGAVIYSDRGTIVAQIAGCAGMQVSAVTRDPAGEILAMASRHDDASGLIEIVRVVSGRVASRCPLPDSDIDRPLRCAASRRHGLLFVHHYVDDDEARLLAFRLADPGLEPVFSVRAPKHGVLAQDPGASEVVWIWDTSVGIKLAALGPEPPSFGKHHGAREQNYLPTLAGYFACHPFGEGDGDPHHELLDAAEKAARGGDWSEVLAILDGVPLATVAPSRAAHLCHLLGLAVLRTGGDPARAREVWEAGLPHDRAEARLGCRLDACLELLVPMPDPLPAEWWNAKAPLVRQFRGAIVTADRHLAAGDPRSALGVLRRRAVTGRGELQSTARLASAWLAIDRSATTEEEFDKAIALARFVSIAKRRLRDLPIEGAWGDDAITSLVARAEEWLAEWSIL